MFSRLLKQIIDYSRLVGIETLPEDVIEDGVQTYFKSFHAQPYSLMCRKSSLGAIHEIHSAVVNPMLALSIRCSSHPFWTDRPKVQSWMNILTEKSWRDLLYLYGEGDTSLQYLQGLCLLAQVDFAGTSFLHLVYMKFVVSFRLIFTSQMVESNVHIPKFRWVLG